MGGDEYKRQSGLAAIMISALRVMALNHVVAGACIAISFTPPVAAHAQAEQQSDDCLHAPVYRLARPIESCTAAIHSGRLSQKDLALAFFQRGIAYTDTRDYDHAIADFTEAIRHNSQDLRVYTERAAIYLDKHDFHHAIADYDEAIRLYPDAYNYDSRAKAYYAKGDYDHAIADYTEALGKASDFAGIGAQLVVHNGALTVVGLIDGGGAAAAGVRANDIITAIDATPVKVRTVFEAMPRLRGSLNSQVKLTISRVGEPQPIDLIVTRRLIHLDQSESAHVLTERGRIYFAMHDYARAMADYNRAIQLDAQNADAYYYRGQARRARGDALGGDADNVHARQLDPDVGKSASNSDRGR